MSALLSQGSLWLVALFGGQLSSSAWLTQTPRPILPVPGVGRLHPAGHTWLTTTTLLLADDGYVNLWLFDLPANRGCRLGALGQTLRGRGFGSKGVLSCIDDAVADPSGRLVLWKQGRDCLITDLRGRALWAASIPSRSAIGWVSDREWFHVELDDDFALKELSCRTVGTHRARTWPLPHLVVGVCFAPVLTVARSYPAVLRFTTRGPNLVTVRWRCGRAAAVSCHIATPDPLNSWAAVPSHAGDRLALFSGERDLCTFAVSTGACSTPQVLGRGPQSGLSRGYVRWRPDDSGFSFVSGGDLYLARLPHPGGNPSEPPPPHELAGQSNAQAQGPRKDGRPPPLLGCQLVWPQAKSGRWTVNLAASWRSWYRFSCAESAPHTWTVDRYDVRRRRLERLVRLEGLLQRSNAVLHEPSLSVSPGGAWVLWLDRQLGMFTWHKARPNGSAHSQWRTLRYADSIWLDADRVAQRCDADQQFIASVVTVRDLRRPQDRVGETYASARLPRQWRDPFTVLRRNVLTQAVWEFGYTVVRQGPLAGPGRPILLARVATPVGSQVALSPGGDQIAWIEEVAGLRGTQIQARVTVVRVGKPGRPRSCMIALPGAESRRGVPQVHWTPDGARLWFAWYDGVRAMDVP